MSKQKQHIDLCVQIVVYQLLICVSRIEMKPLLVLW